MEGENGTLNPPDGTYGEYAKAMCGVSRLTACSSNFALRSLRLDQYAASYAGTIAISA
jgi:hypothetical protein